MSNTIYWDKLRILVTNRCNYRCPFCHNEGQSSENASQDMDYNHFKILLNALKDEEISEITFSGGEPFLNKNLIRMIQYTSDNTDWELSCASNLSLITKEQVLQLAHIPLKFNIQFPYIETDKFHTSTRGGSIDRVMTNIQILRSAGLEVGLNCVIQSDSTQEVRSMILYALEEELPLKLLPQIGLLGSQKFKAFVFPILEEYAISCKDKGTGAIRWILEKDGHQTSVLYIDSPCFMRDIECCKRYSEVRVLPDLRLQTCILHPTKAVTLDLKEENEGIKQQFREAWKSWKHC